MTKITAEAVQNAAILRALYGDPPAAAGCATKQEFAALVGRDPSNLNRSLKSLLAAGLIGEAEGFVPPLTDAGRGMVEALDRADEIPPAGAAAAFWPHNLIRPDPENRKSAAEEIDDIAESIAFKGVLQPLRLSPPDTEGVRMIRAGERRWRGVGKLIAEGREGFAADHPMPFVEGSATLETEGAEQAFVAIVENGQRVEMTPLESARKFARLIAETGWSAREAALRTGFSAKIRVVQEGQRVLKRAAPEDIAAHEADPEKFTWEKLRDSVKDLELTPQQGLVLLELADKVAREGVFIPPSWGLGEEKFAAVSPLPADGAGHEVWNRDLIQVGVGRDDVTYARVKQGKAPVARWLQLQGFDEDRDELLRKAREAVAGPQAALMADDRGRYLTPWLNVRAAAEPEANPAPARAAASHGASSSPGWKSPPDPAAVKRAERLGVEEKLALLELAHSAAHNRGLLLIRPASAEGGSEYRRAVPARDAAGNVVALLTGLREPALIHVFESIGPHHCGRPAACLTNVGQKVVHALAPGLQSTDIPDGDERLDKALAVLGLQPQPGRYRTEWLNEDWDLGAQADLVKDLGHGDPDALHLNARARLALAELRHKIIAEGVEIDGEEGAVIGPFWLDGAFVHDLTKARLVRTAPRAGQRFLGVVTPKGLDWLAANLELGMGGLIGEQLLARLRAEAGHASWEGPGYVSAFLNVDVTSPPERPPVETAPPTFDDRAELQARVEAEAQARETIAADVDSFIRLGRVGLGPLYGGKLKTLLSACLGPGPYGYDPDCVGLTNGSDETFLLVDTDGFPADEVQHAGGRLVAHLIQHAVEDAAAEDAPVWVAPPDGETPLQALLRCGRLVRDLMVAHYDALKEDLTAAHTYRQLSEAIGRVELELKAASAQTEEAA